MFIKRIMKNPPATRSVSLKYELQEEDKAYKQIKQSA